MRSQRIKDLYFTAMMPATYANHLRIKRTLRREISARFRTGSHGAVWLNLGSGAHPHGAFLNIDANILQRPDLWLDARHGLPFPSGSVDAIYACHVLEHFYPGELSRVLAECRRVLRDEGGLRLLVPSLEMAVEAYLKGDHAWFSGFPREFSSLGGRFVNFIFCDGQHRSAFDFSFALEVLGEAGFVDIQQVLPRQGSLFPTRVLEELEPAVGYIDTSLVVEARARIEPA